LKLPITGYGVVITDDILLLAIADFENGVEVLSPEAIGQLNILLEDEMSLYPAANQKGIMAVLMSYWALRGPWGVASDVATAVFYLQMGAQVLNVMINNMQYVIYQGTGYDYNSNASTPIVHVNNGIASWY